MALLHFSFEGESKNASPLVSKTKRFNIEFDALDAYTMAAMPVFSLEYFDTIFSYAENLNDMMHLMAIDENIDLEKLEIKIVGQVQQHDIPTLHDRVYNKIEISITAASNAKASTIKSLLNKAQQTMHLSDFLPELQQLNVSFQSYINLN
jgi:hypothetical protein